MSYSLYINGNKVKPIINRDIALTKQVNNIASVEDRNSNYSNIIFLPMIAENVKAMQFCYIEGNDSNFPYQKNTAELIDDETGKHLVYNGRAVIRLTSERNGYEINLYDGIIDFFKKIENKTITDCGISDLNHLKNVQTVLDSWQVDLPYLYIIADYNGKMLDGSALNIDYLVPSAKVSYIFDRIHAFAGFTYSGIFSKKEGFLNLFMTYPKAVPIETPITTLVTNQQSAIQQSQVTFPVGNGVFFGSSIFANLLPSTFNTAQANNTSGGVINFTEQGAYRIKVSGAIGTPFETSGVVVYKLTEANGTIIQEGTLDAQIDQSITLSVQVGYKLTLNTILTGFNSPQGFVDLSGTITTTIELLLGFDADFEEVFIDFQAKDFIKEIYTIFALTPFRDKYQNHIEYLNIDEILQNDDVIDWSSKFIKKNSESYVLNNYAQLNEFKYKYNDDFENHKNGSIRIENVNIPDKRDLFVSKTFAPEKVKTSLIGQRVNVYKIWDKELRDNGDINYKELTGRYYFLRKEVINIGAAAQIKSVALNTQSTFTIAPFESDYRLHFQQIIFDNWSSIESILSKAKLINASFYLSSIDYENYDFKRLIYIKQLQSYYLVNRIPNYVKGSITNVEIIEVDYFKKIDEVDVSIDLSIVSIQINNCQISITVGTNLPSGVQVQIIPYLQNITGGYSPLNLIINSTITNGVINFPADQLQGGLYQFMVRYVNDAFEFFDSQLSTTVLVPNNCFIVPNFPSTLNLIRASFLGQIPNYFSPFLPPIRQYNLTYEHTGIASGTTYILIVEVFGSVVNPNGWSYHMQTTKIAGDATDLIQFVEITIETKIRIRINQITSNEIVL